MLEDIKQRFAKAGIELTEKQLLQMDTLIGFLQEYCKKVNLTAIRDREGIIGKHLIDSVLPLTLTEVQSGAKCLDIGTGAGFPAVPMMIYRPDLRFTLLDAQQKRTVYLQQLLERLELKAEIIHGRAEELCRKDGYKGGYDMVTARAVGSLPLLLGYACPFLRKGGRFAALRGSAEEEQGEVQKALGKLRMEKVQETCYSLPKGDGRRLVVFERS
ncbi:MAG: 16S rRNA (guanine(527)-N(7))-methyltransferase RsmG [Oscillospiraceae bacterium]|nr:16S rRNA (guanine(527)-N(7))-methyltransferase RsmG [Oscillospiraceae bacterium]